MARVEATMPEERQGTNDRPRLRTLAAGRCTVDRRRWLMWPLPERWALRIDVDAERHVHPQRWRVTRP